MTEHPHRSLLPAITRRLAEIAPFAIPAPPGLVEAADAVDTKRPATEIATATTLLALAVGTVLLVVLTATIGPRPSTLSWAILVAGCTGATPIGLLSLLATRTDARRRGSLPGFVCRVALGMRFTPTLESGVASARTAGGPIAHILSLRRGRSAAAVLADAVADLGPGADRAHGLLVAAATATDHERLLDRAVDTALDATREHARSYATGLRGPVTAIYAFGVVLPLALVGILPVAPLAGITLPIAGIAVVLDLLLPMAILGGTGWLVARRPRIDPRPTIAADDPALGPRATTAAALTGGVLAGVAVSSMLAGWTRWLLPLAWGPGAALLARYQPARPAVEAADAVRLALPDLLAVLGDAMADGAPPARALDGARELPGTAGDLAAAAATRSQQLGVRVPGALTGTHGPLAVLDSQQASSVAALVSSAASAGRPGGRALSRYADHLDALHDLDREIATDLARITDTLSQTAAIYAPAIGGVTVALATRIDTHAAPLPAVSDALPLVVGVYVLVLAIVLPGIASTLEHGWCRVRIGTSVGRTLVIAGATFPLTARLAGVLL